MLPGTLPVPELARRLADTDAAVIMKLGRTFPGVRRGARASPAGWPRRRYVERASTGAEVVRRWPTWIPRPVPYFSMIIVPGRDRRADSAGRARAADHSSRRPATRRRPDVCWSSASGPGRIAG